MSSREQQPEPGQSREFQEQKIIEAIARMRHKNSAGIQQIQPILTPDEKTEMWMVILTTGKPFEHLVTVVDRNDIQRYQKEQEKIETDNG